jgi:hypothetical protein
VQCGSIGSFAGHSLFCMAHTISDTNLKIGQVNRQIYKVPACMMLESGRIRLVRSSAVIITHKNEANPSICGCQPNKMTGGQTYDEDG